MYFCQSGGREVHILLLADLVSGEDSLPVSVMPVFWLCPHMVERELSGVSFIRDSSSLMTLSPPKDSPHWRLGSEQMNLGGEKNIVYIRWGKERGERDFLVIWWLRLCNANSGGAGLSPDGGTKVLHAVLLSQKIKKKKNRIKMGVVGERAGGGTAEGSIQCLVGTYQISGTFTPWPHWLLVQASVFHRWWSEEGSR